MPRIRLTEQSCSRLKPDPGKQIEYYDTGLQGLMLRVSYGGAKTFMAVHYPGGKTKTFKLGRYHPDGAATFPDPESGVDWPRDLNLNGARDAARKFFAKPSSFLSPRSRPKVQTFAAVSEEYLIRYAAKFRSLPELKRMLGKYINPVLGERAFLDIKRSEVVALRNSVAENHGPSQADAVFSLIRAIMHWFADFGEHDDYVVPIKGAKRRGKSATHGVSRSRVLKADEIRLVWSAAESLGVYGNLVKLLLLTGQRREKVATMRWRDIKDGVWIITTEPGEKGNAGRLRLPSLALAIIEKINEVAGCSYVFAGRYGDKPFNSFSQGKEEINALLPPTMPPWTLHDLRRTARTLMSDLRVDQQTAELVLGHSIGGGGVAAVYDRSEYFEQKAEALDRLASHIQRLIGQGYEINP